MQDRKTYEKRRREYAERLPAHYCASCTSVTYPEDAVCIECGQNAPDDGWPSIQDGFDPWVGRVLDGRYLMTRRVGQGASGSVYRAESLAISREFAVKIINFKQAPAGIEPEQIRARLHREIEAISRLRNPHVVPFYEVIELYDNFVGIVMDFVDGDTLEQKVRNEGPLSMSRAGRMLRQIANGVHEAHEVGMIHRDLKPENLMVEIMPAGDDFVHILDFGIVRLDDGVSMTKGFLGTPLYASPEQAMAGDVDRRSDIYSLGAIFFYLLTGRPPFVSDNVYEILRAHVRSPAPKIREVAPDRGFPPELEDLVDSMLAKSPINRPQTLAEVISRVDHLLNSGMLESSHVEDDAVSTDEPAGRTSQEIDAIKEDRRRPNTGPQPAVKLKSIGADSSESDFHRDERQESGSFVVSSDRDDTGPKAAIFRRNPSRNSLRQMVQESKQTMERVEFDRRLQSDTDVFSVGIELGQDVATFACASSGTMVVVDVADNVYLGGAGGVEKAFHSRSPVRSVAALGDGSALIGCENGSVFHVVKGERAVRVFQDVRQAPMTSIASDSKGATLVAGSESGRIYLCRSKDGDLTSWNRIQDGPPVLAVDVNKNGNMFAVARKHKEVELYNLSSPKAHFARYTTPDYVTDLAFSIDGHLVAALMDEGEVMLNMVLTGQRALMLKDERHELLSVSFNGDNSLIGYFEVDQAVFGIDLQRELSPETA